MLECFSEYLKKSECDFVEYQDLTAASHIGVGAVARFVVYPDRSEKLIDILRKIKELSVPFIVLGRMSNVLFRDSIYDGIVVRTDKISKKYVAENRLKLECGCTLPKVARQIAEYDLGGFEGLLGIPGSIGGMIRQNAGAFGYEISDRCVSCSIYNTATDELIDLTRDEMRFGYRTSVLENKNLILLSACFEALQKTKKAFLEEVASYAEIRRQTQPTNEPSLGSVFKRACGVGAGYYIDRLNLKGFSVGGAQISTKHAGFIVNKGGATSNDVLTLIDIIKNRVFDSFGITLEEEIEII